MPLKVSHGAIRSQRTRALLPSEDAFSGLSDQKGEHALSRGSDGKRVVGPTLLQGDHPEASAQG